MRRVVRIWIHLKLEPPGGLICQMCGVRERGESRAAPKFLAKLMEGQRYCQLGLEKAVGGDRFG